MDSSLSITEVRDSLWAVLATISVLLMAAWSVSGWKSLTNGPLAHMFRGRNIAVLSGLCPLLLTDLLHISEHFTPHWTVTVAVSVASFGFYLVLDPSHDALWLRRRLRIPVSILALAGGAGLGLLLERTEMIPVIFGAAIFHQHQRSVVRVAVQSFEEALLLRQKIQAMAAERQTGRIIEVAHTIRIRPDSRDDNLPKAG